MPKRSMAVIMTCHNRKDLTLTCLDHLFMQTIVESTQIDVLLVDDGSTDGTGQAVKQKYPYIKVLKGNGNLFWCGGMRLAFGEALQCKYDFYLWLNDDAKLYHDALSKMLDTYDLLSKQQRRDVIVVGSLCDHKTFKLTYGGRRFQGRYNPAKYKMVQPAKEPKRCDIFHGNCVLMSRRTAVDTGNMSGKYLHGPGDMDYALRALKNGFNSWICPGYVGTCSRNQLLERWKNKNLSMEERIKALNHPIVLIRIKDWLIFMKTYYKLFWPYFYLSSMIRFYFPRLFIMLKSSFIFEKR